MKKTAFTFLLIVLCGVSFFLFFDKKEKPLVSVIMPIYNRSDLASRAIESILNQTMKDFEFIIVDDGSDEKTKKVIKQYADKDHRIKTIINPKNRGIAYSRQRGIDVAKGTYVAIMDSDDWSVPDRLEKSLSFMKDHPDVTHVFGAIYNIKKGEFIPKYTVSDPKKYTVYKQPGFYEVELMFFNKVNNVASFFVKDFVDKNHIKYDFNLIAAEDYDYWRQFVIHGAKIASLSDPLVYVRSHNTNSGEYYNGMYENSVKIHNKMFSLFFNPSAEELKVAYTIQEKCSILNKIKEANLKKPRFPQIYLENSYEAECPNDFSNAYYLSHSLNNWFGYIEKKGDKWVRIATNDKADLVKKGDKKIVLEWEGYPSETFELQKDGRWEFIPEGKKITLKHINWSDDFILTKYNTGCRVNVTSECANVEKKPDDVIVIDWLNDSWPNEEFKKNKKGIYEFVQ